MSGQELQPHEMSSIRSGLPDFWRDNGGLVGWGLGAAILIAGGLLLPLVSGNETHPGQIAADSNPADNTPGAVAVPPKSD